MVTLEEETEGDEEGELELTKKALKKAREDYRVSNVALGAVRVELTEQKQKFAILQQSLENSNAKSATGETSKKLLERANVTITRDISRDFQPDL
jgi:hypothetical protein